MTPPESLTESERERIGRVTTCELENSADEAEARANAVAKLLRIHDRLQGAEARALDMLSLEAECREGWRGCLEARDRVINLGMRQAQELKAAKARIAELETYCKAQAEANETLAQCLRERDTMLQQARAEGFGVIRVDPETCDHRFGSHGDTCVKCGKGAY